MTCLSTVAEVVVGFKSVWVHRIYSYIDSKSILISQVMPGYDLTLVPFHNTVWSEMNENHCIFQTVPGPPC